MEIGDHLFSNPSISPIKKNLLEYHSPKGETYSVYTKFKSKSTICHQGHTSQVCVTKIPISMIICFLPKHYSHYVEETREWRLENGQIKFQSLRPILRFISTEANISPPAPMCLHRQTEQFHHETKGFSCVDLRYFHCIKWSPFELYNLFKSPTSETLEFLTYVHNYKHKLSDKGKECPELNMHLTLIIDDGVKLILSHDQ